MRENPFRVLEVSALKILKNKGFSNFAAPIKIPKRGQEKK